MFDPSSLSDARPAKKLRLPSQTIQQSLDIKTTEKPDGFSRLTLKQPLRPNGRQVGADLGVASARRTATGRAGRCRVGRDERSSGAAWASVGVTRSATVDARVDPTKMRASSAPP